MLWDLRVRVVVDRACCGMLALSSLRTRAAVALPQLVRSMATKTREMVMGRAHRGLYGGKHIQFGNNVSHSHRKCAA